MDVKSDLLWNISDCSCMEINLTTGNLPKNTDTWLVSFWIFFFDMFYIAHIPWFIGTSSWWIWCRRDIAQIIEVIYEIIYLTLYNLLVTREGGLQKEAAQGLVHPLLPSPHIPHPRASRGYSHQLYLILWATSWNCCYFLKLTKQTVKIRGFGRGWRNHISPFS